MWVRSALLAMLLVLVAATAAVAQTEAPPPNRFALGGEFKIKTSDRASQEDYARGQLGPGVLWRFGETKPGWGFHWGLNWYAVKLERPIGDSVTELGELHVRPIMAGYGYTRKIRSYSITADVLGGYGFGTIQISDPAKAAYRRALGVTEAEANATNTLVLKPEIGRLVRHDEKGLRQRQRRLHDGAPRRRGGHQSPAPFGERRAPINSSSRSVSSTRSSKPRNFSARRGVEDGMNIVIAGGTGFLGRPLTASLVRDGHDVIILTRESTASGAGARAVPWNPNGDTGPWAEAIDGADAVVNLAGEPIAGKRWTAAHKQRHPRQPHRRDAQPGCGDPRRRITTDGIRQRIRGRLLRTARRRDRHRRSSRRNRFPRPRVRAMGADSDGARRARARA